MPGAGSRLTAWIEFSRHAIQVVLALYLTKLHCGSQSSARLGQV